MIYPRRRCVVPQIIAIEDLLYRERKRKSETSRVSALNGRLHCSLCRVGIIRNSSTTGFQCDFNANTISRCWRGKLSAVKQGLHSLNGL